MNADWQEKQGFTLHLTCGIESGMIACSVVRAGAREELSSFGPTVNLAARIQGACGQLDVGLLLGPCVRSLVRHSVPTGLVAEVSLKGIADPVPVYRLTPDSPGAPPGDPT